MRTRSKAGKIIRGVLIILIFIAAAAMLGAFDSITGDESGEVRIYEELSDLDGARVGMTTGTNYTKVINEKIRDAEIIYYDSFNELVPALEQDMIDCFVANTPWAKSICAADSKITYMDERLADENYAFAFAKTSEGNVLRQQFNAYLKEIGQNGALELMKQQWLSTDTSPVEALDFKTLPSTNGMIKAVTDAENPPFEYYQEGKLKGYDVALIYGFCEKYGYGLSVTDMYFSGLIPGVVSGRYDIGFSSLTITEERSEVVNFSDVTYSSGPVVVIASAHSVGGVSADGAGFFSKLSESYKKTFIREERWRMFISGILITIMIAVLSIIFGNLAGFGLYYRHRQGGWIADNVVRFLGGVLTGMPDVLLLLILYYLVFGKIEAGGIFVSVVTFTIIFSMEVFDLLSTGVDSLDPGQTEAALALGYSENEAFFRILFPQACENMALNYRRSVISLVKSTAIVGYVAVQDLTKVSDIVRSRTYEGFFPLITTAIIYFILAWLAVLAVKRFQIHFLPFRRPKTEILEGVDTGIKEEGK